MAGMSRLRYQQTGKKAKAQEVWNARSHRNKV
jgi:hypothetical protein